jgi:uncharacterized membrane protein YcaP (DUF421 family)
MDSVLRATAIYLFLVLVFRITGKRSLSSITTFDFVLLLVIGEATQQALLGDDYSVTNGLLVIVTLIVLSLGFDRLKRLSPHLDRFLEDLPIIVVKDGKPIEDRMRMVNVDVEDVLEAARSGQGIGRLDQIAYAVLERSGEISVIPKQA